MNEILLGTGPSSATGGYYPGSGPGSKNLIRGDENIGYFGELSTGELITNLQIKQHLNVAVPDARALPDKDWFKFMHNGQVKFIGKGMAMASVQWRQMYLAGGVYGTDDTGLFPSGAAPTNQYKPIEIIRENKIWRLIPRMLKGAPEDPAVAVPAQDLQGSEYNDLLYRICIGSAGGPHPNQGAFASYTIAQCAMNVAHAAAESMATDSSRCLIRGYRGVPLATMAALTKVDPSGYSQQIRMVLVVEGDPLVEPPNA